MHREMQDHERAWLAVSDTARDLAELREPRHVLDAIVKRGRGLLGGHLAWLAGPAPDHDEDLCVLAIDGVSTEWAREMRATRGGGAAGYTRRTRSPFATADYYADERLIHDPRIDAILRSEGVQSMVAVPMMSVDGFLGVLVIADRAAREFTHREIAALSALASHATVALRNAMAFDRSRLALEAAERGNRLLEQRTAALEFAADAHERLSRIVAQGGGIDELCGTVARLLDGDVFVVDAVDEVLCRAAGRHPDPASGRQGEPDGRDARRAPLSGSRLHAAIDASRTSGHSVTVPAEGAHDCRVSAIVGGTRLLGGLVVRAPAPLPDPAVRTLERAALVLAVMMLAPERAPGADAGRRADLLAALLNPLRAGSAELARRAAAFGVRDGAAAVLALLAPGRTDAGAIVQRLLSRLDARGALMVADLDGQVAILACGGSPDSIRATLREALRGAAWDGVTGVVPETCSRLAALPGAFGALQRSLRMLALLGRHGEVRLEAELAPFAAAFCTGGVAPDDCVVRYVDTLIGRVLQHDRERGARIASTLLAYLDHGHNAKVAAGRLGVHVNTLAKRLDLAAELTGGWAAPGRTLELHLALRLAALSGEGMLREPQADDRQRPLTRAA